MFNRSGAVTTLLQPQRCVGTGRWHQSDSLSYKSATQVSWCHRQSSWVVKLSSYNSCCRRKVCWRGRVRRADFIVKVQRAALPETVTPRCIDCKRMCTWWGSLADWLTLAVLLIIAVLKVEPLKKIKISHFALSDIFCIVKTIGLFSSNTMLLCHNYTISEILFVCF